MNPGPLKEDVLFLKKEHIAYAKFQKGDVEELQFKQLRRGDKKLWTYLESIQINDRLESIILRAGFGGILSCGFQPADNGLITALAERWRPETHTFHLPVGETTITLQDINVLFALPIEGDAISFGKFEMGIPQIYERVHNLLGFMPTPTDFKQGRKYLLKYTSIRSFLENNILPPEPTQIQLNQHARCIILHILGSSLFNNTDNQGVNVQFLDLLEDLDNCRRYSWGSAVLAFIYKSLCKAVISSERDLVGPMWMVQIWAWSKIKSLGPSIVLRRGQQHNFALPFASRYVNKLSFEDAPSHSARAIRATIQGLQHNDFEWLPYDNYMGRLTDSCTNGSASWLCQCFLIFWEIVEFYDPTRVLRQFGITQNIPRNIQISKNEHKKLHETTKTGGSRTDWRHKHRSYIDSWNNRHNTRYLGTRINDAPTLEPGYLEWYRERTVTYIINPGVHHEGPPPYQDLAGMSQMMMDGMTQIREQGSQLVGPSVPLEVPPEYLSGVENMYNTAEQMLGYTGDWALSQYPSHFQTSPVDHGMNEFEPRRHHQRASHKGRGGTHDIAGASGSRQYEQQDVFTQTTFDLNQPPF